jgi:hypothetical protein
MDTAHERMQMKIVHESQGLLMDNFACEGFFGHLKNEMFYSHNQRGVTVAEFKKTLAR